MPPVVSEAGTNLFSAAYVQGFDCLVYFEAHGEVDGSFRGYSIVTVAGQEIQKTSVLECEGSNHKVLFLNGIRPCSTNVWNFERQPLFCLNKKQMKPVFTSSKTKSNVYFRFIGKALTPAEQFNLSRNHKRWFYHFASQDYQKWNHAVSLSFCSSLILKLNFWLKTNLIIWSWVNLSYLTFSCSRMLFSLRAWPRATAPSLPRPL